MLGRLLALFIGVPLIEFYLFWTVGDRIGIIATFATILLTGVLGAWLTKRQGLRTLERYRKTAGEGRIPHTEVMDGLMILLAGAFLLTPGFLTDAVGFALLFPPVRACVRIWLGRHLAGKINVIATTHSTIRSGADPQFRQPPPRERVVDAKVIDD
ncbi:FxsA family protein [soil metagenome]